MPSVAELKKMAFSQLKTVKRLKNRAAVCDVFRSYAPNDLESFHPPTYDPIDEEGDPCFYLNISKNGVRMELEIEEQCTQNDSSSPCDSGDVNWDSLMMSVYVEGIRVLTVP